MRLVSGRSVQVGLVVLSVLASGAAVHAGRVPVEQAAASAGLPVRDIVRGDQSNIDGLREVVVRNQADWQALWRDHNYDAPAPRVDFGKEMIVAVFLGSQTSAGHSVRIAEVTAGGDALVVKYQVSRPAPGGVAAQVLTFPFHIVAVPARAGTTRFERNLP